MDGVISTSGGSSAFYIVGRYDVVYGFDHFASYDKEKYYAVFAYDDVPNFSEPAMIKYNPLEKY